MYGIMIIPPLGSCWFDLVGSRLKQYRFLSFCSCPQLDSIMYVPGNASPMLCA